jgi:hypothetical protein
MHNEVACLLPKEMNYVIEMGFLSIDNCGDKVNKQYDMK